MILSGDVTNKSSYWIADDVDVEIVLRNSSGSVIRTEHATVTGSISLRPGAATAWEYVVQPNGQAGETTEAGRVRWRWRSPEEPAPELPTRTAVPIPTLGATPTPSRRCDDAQGVVARGVALQPTILGVHVTGFAKNTCTYTRVFGLQFALLTAQGAVLATMPGYPETLPPDAEVAFDQLVYVEESRLRGAGPLQARITPKFVDAP